MTAATTSSRGRKRLRREEEDTPPRVSLEELEQQDRAQQKPIPGRAVLEQPQAAAKPEATGGKSAIKHHGQSSMTDFLTIAPAAQTGLSAAMMVRPCAELLG